MARIDMAHRVAFLLGRNGRTDRLHFQRNAALLALAKGIADLWSQARWPDTEPLLVAMSWVDPFHLIDPWMDGTLPTTIGVSTFLFFSLLVRSAVLRARDVGWPPWTGLLTAVPYLNGIMTLVFALRAPKRRSIWDLV